MLSGHLGNLESTVPRAWLRLLDVEERRIDGGAPFCHARRFVLLWFWHSGSRGSTRFAQGEAKKEAQPPKAEAAPKEAAKTDAAKTEPAKKDETPKAEAPRPTEPPLPPIPPEVQAKIDAARKAVAEAIVAAQDAGLVETSIDPPPILDILITGRATDSRTLKNTTAKKPYAVSPEVFGAWFTGYGKLEGINYADDVRIINPSAGLKQWYDTRARILGAVHPGNPQGQGPGGDAQERRGQAGGNQESRRTQEGRSQR